ncbi:hypothetical protein D3C77_406790 [compost metagenome]
MHQAGEGEQHEQGQAQEHVQFVHQADRGNRRRGLYRTQQHGVLRPLGEHHHYRAVHVSGGGDNGQQTEHQLRQQHQQDQDVRGVGGGANPWIGQAPVDQHDQADQAQQAEKAAGDHRQQLLVFSADHMVIDRSRGQQADKVPGQDEQHANVKQVARRAHAAPGEHLAGAGLPGVLRQVETRPAAQQADRQSNIGIHPERQQIPFRHCPPP